jgi:hypothetical protein
MINLNSLSDSELAQAVHELALVAGNMSNDLAREAIACRCMEIQELLNGRLFWAGRNGDRRSFAHLFEARDALYRAQSGLSPEEQAELRLEAQMLGEDSPWNY